MNNCLFWAIAQKIKFGGKINPLKSKTWKGFHVTWTDPQGNEWEYTVPRMRRKPWWYMPILYTGVVKQVHNLKL